jgi:hypothetical protein
MTRSRIALQPPRGRASFGPRAQQVTAAGRAHPTAVFTSRLRRPLVLGEGLRPGRGDPAWFMSARRYINDKAENHFGSSERGWSWQMQRPRTPSPWGSSSLRWEGTVAINEKAMPTTSLRSHPRRRVESEKLTTRPSSYQRRSHALGDTIRQPNPSMRKEISSCCDAEWAPFGLPQKRAPVTWRHQRPRAAAAWVSGPSRRCRQLGRRKRPYGIGLCNDAMDNLPRRSSVCESRGAAMPVAD